MIIRWKGNLRIIYFQILKTHFIQYLIIVYWGKRKKMGGSKIILNIVSYFLLHRSIKVKIGNNYSEIQNIPLVFLRV